MKMIETALNIIFSRTMQFSLAMSLFVIAANNASALTGSEGNKHLTYCKQGVIHKLREEAEMGNAASQFTLAFMYGRGHCLDRNDKKKHDWLWRAASHGHSSALYELAIIYYQGTGVKKDLKHATVLLHWAAEKGSVEAQYGVGMNFIRGHKNSQTQGLYWLEMAAMNGHGMSALVIGFIHEKGMLGTTKNPCLARDWYEKGVQHGMMDSQYYIDRMDKKGLCKD